MKNFAAAAATLALGLSLTACSFGSSPEPAAVETTPAATATVEPSKAPAAKPSPKPVEPVEMPTVEPVEAPMVHVAPADFPTDAPEYVEPPVVEPVIPEAPVEPVQSDISDLDLGAMGYVQDATTGAWIMPEAPVNPAPGAQVIPVPVETFVPHTFAEPKPEGMPEELTRPVCDSAAGYVYDYTSAGCVYVGDANLGQGMGGNYAAPCNVDPALDTTGNNRPEYPSCADVAAANGF